MSLIRFVTRIHFADRVLEDALPSELARAAIRKPLVVTDHWETPHLRDRLAGVLPRVAGSFAVSPTTGPTVPASGDAVARQATLLGADALLAFGGAAAIAAARAAAVAPLGRVAACRLPLIVVPVVPEGGAGLGNLSGLADEEGAREPLSGLPRAVLCDPTLLLGRAGAELAAAAMDALAHCLEAWLASAFNPPADGIALEGLRRCALAIERAVTDPADLDARRDLLAAALNGALAEQKGLGAAEALARSLEAETGIPHGIAHGALLPGILAFNAPAAGARYHAAAEALAFRGADLAEGLAALALRLDLPRRLPLQGPDAACRISRRAEADPATRTNPRLIREADYHAILARAL